MATLAPDPVEKWAPIFTKQWAGADARLFDVNYLISTSPRDGDYCKLCDHRVPLGVNHEAHVRQHREELAGWRERQRAVAADAREADGAGPTGTHEGSSEPVPAPSGLPPERRLRNRISSLRHRLKNPPKKDYTSEQRRAILDQIQATQAELAALEEEALRV